MGWLLLCLVFLFGCSDFGCPDGLRVGGLCQPATADIDPEPKTRTIPLACDTSLLPQVGVGWGWWAWELTVDPIGPIRSGEKFAVEFEVNAVFPEFFVKLSQETVSGGVSRVQAIDLRATVHVRRGAEDPEPVELTFHPDEFPWTCRYTSTGEEVSEEEDFPPCSVDNDNLDGSNDDCTGLDGKPDPRNRCGQFVPIPISEDCDPGGECASVVYDNPHLGWSAMEMCKKNGFCVTGPVEVPLEGTSDTYVAEESGQVLFGWDDVTTGAELDQSGGPNDGTLNLQEADFDNDRAPNGMRVRARDLEIALECTMAVGGWAVFGVNSRDDRPAPAPDHMLISFPIQEP
jgi:hypothetical protein